jgi:hypothetical protein
MIHASADWENVQQLVEGLIDSLPESRLVFHEVVYK